MPQAQQIKETLKSILPAPLLGQLLFQYHFLLAFLGALIYGFPSRSLIVIGITGTKGKTSVTEMVNAIFEEAGYKTALLNSIRFKVAGSSEPNLTRMSMPGRFFIQELLRNAREAKCDVAILEMTSEGARQSRHRFIDMNALVFTNLAPEHIESHGSFKKYGDAKFEIGKQLLRSQKRPRIVVANADDKEGMRYLTLAVEYPLPFSLSAHLPFFADEHGGFFTFDGLRINLHLPGAFSLRNAIAAAVAARAFGIQPLLIARAFEKLQSISGRAERIEAGQDFAVVVDYAHTPDSLTALYDAYGNTKKICVLGATGGGRDAWKRPVMGRIAAERCTHVILTDEDPYEENPRQIAEDMAHGMAKAPEIIMDRRKAISRALEIASNLSIGGAPLDEARGNQNAAAVLITGKGTDPTMCVANGQRIPWSDAGVAREEITALLKARGV